MISGRNEASIKILKIFKNKKRSFLRPFAKDALISKIFKLFSEILKFLF